MTGKQRLHHAILARVHGGGVGIDDGAGVEPAGSERHAHLHARSGRDPALRLQFAPRATEEHRPNQGEDVRFPAILANERRRQAEAAARLHRRTRAEPEAIGGQHVRLVIDDEPPVRCHECAEMARHLRPARPGGERLVGGNRHREERATAAVVDTDSLGR